METYEYTPPEKKEEPKNIDKLDKLFGKEPPQPNIPPQPKTPPQPAGASPQDVGHAPTPKPAIELSPEQTHAYKEEEERKDALQKQLGMRSGETIDKEYIDREFSRIKSTVEQPKPGMNMVSVILTVVIAAVTLMIGLVIFANIEGSIPSAPEAAPAVQEAAEQVAMNIEPAFNFLALGLFILAAVFIIGIVAGVAGGPD